MSVITSADYQLIVDNYAEGRLCQLEVENEFYANLAIIVNLQEPFLDVEVDLLSPFNQSYNTVSAQNTITPSYFLSNISSLHTHIINRATDGAGAVYTDINDWLSDNSVLVYNTFAEMSEDAGWPIDHDNIKSDPTLSFS